MCRLNTVLLAIYVRVCIGENAGMPIMFCQCIKKYIEFIRNDYIIVELVDL